MALTAADVLVETIADWGVEVVFGLPGDGINGVMEALRKRRDRIAFVQVRHEESAAFMACGYAKFTGKLGVCLATSGPGGIHLLNGLYDAKLDGAPVLAITGMAAHDLIATHTQQDVELDKLFGDVARYNVRVMGPAHVENVTDLACRIALADRGVCHLSMPVDVQEMRAGRSRSPRNIPGHTSDVATHSARLPEEGDLQRAAEVLNAGRRVAILAGRGALGAGELVERAADLLAGPIVKPLLGKGVVPDDSPLTTGPVGLLGSRPSQVALEKCDTLLMIGTSFPYLEYYPPPGQARGVQIDADPTRIGLRYPVEVGLVGDSRRTLEALLPLLARKANRDFLETAQAGMADWRALMQERASRPDVPMKPEVLAHALGERLRHDAIVACDSGTIATWWARHIPARRGQLHSISGNLASMANGLPYAIAAQIAYPTRQVVAFVGDGGFSMLMAEFATAVKYRLPIKVIVVKNNSLGMIKWEQMTFLGNPEFGCDLQPIDFALFARACGGTGFTVEDPAECGAVLDRALAAPGPTLVEARVDPLEPPYPPKLTVSQVSRFAAALARSSSDRGRLAWTVLADRMRHLV